jgi:hypothetical protein
MGGELPPSGWTMDADRLDIIKRHDAGHMHPVDTEDAQQGLTAWVALWAHLPLAVRGPKTQMLCRGNSTTMGHGSGECQTFEGAVWAISW